MSNPCAVVPFVCLALLVGTDLGERSSVRFGIVLDRDLRSHPPHRKRAPSVARLDEQSAIRKHERLRHSYLLAIGQDDAAVVSKRLDVAEDVIPSSAVEASGMLPQLMENLIHLERSRQGLDENGCLDCTPRHTQGVLCINEYVVPEPGFAV